MSSWWKFGFGQASGLPATTQDVQSDRENLPEELQPLLLNNLREGPKAWAKSWLARSLLLVCGVIIVMIIFAVSVLSVFRRSFDSGVTTITPNNTIGQKLLTYHPLGANKSKGAHAITEGTLYDVGGPRINGYVAVIKNALPHFHVTGTCRKPARTSVTARTDGCRWAMNGGPFNSYLRGGCMGPTVMHGNLVNRDWNSSLVTFGVSKIGQWLIGHMGPAAYDQYGVTEAVTGFGWLVKDGKNVAPDVPDVAERTSIGINADGDLLMLQVDGCEKCPFSGGPSGLTLSRMADLLISQGALHAINLDGGGSSTTVVNGEVKNRPDCLELGISCERPVTSVVCVL